MSSKDCGGTLEERELKARLLGACKGQSAVKVGIPPYPRELLNPGKEPWKRRFHQVVTDVWEKDVWDREKLKGNN